MYNDCLNSTSRTEKKNVFDRLLWPPNGNVQQMKSCAFLFLDLLCLLSLVR
jgi:hypothetical protein